MRGERYAFPEGQKITDAYRDTRKSEHQRNHEVQSIFSRNACADDYICSRQPKSDPENQGYPAEKKRIIYQAGAFHQNYPEVVESPIGWKRFKNPSSGKSGQSQNDRNQQDKGSDKKHIQIRAGFQKWTGFDHPSFSRCSFREAGILPFFHPPSCKKKESDANYGRNNHGHDPHIFSMLIRKVIGDIDVGYRREKVHLSQNQRSKPVRKRPQEYHNGARQITRRAEGQCDGYEPPKP